MQRLRKVLPSLAVKHHKLLKSHIRNQLRCLSTIDHPPGAVERPTLSIPQGTFGQATCHTHPHLIQQGHLTCGITQKEYAERRETLISRLVSEAPNVHKTHIVVIPAARKQFMSDKIPYVFRQNSDFFYLTGCLEPSAILVMIKPAHSDTFKSVLFVHEKDSHAELWEGPRTGCTAATQLFAVDEARPVDSFSVYINKLAASSKPSVLWYHNEAPANPEIHSTIRSVIHPETQVTLADPQRTLHFMRVIKSPAEVELMKEVCYIGSQSVNTAMACTKPGISEHAVCSVLEHSGRVSGAEHSSFPAVVAGAARAAHIHYVANNQLLNHGDLLLVDSGCQRWLYNSDISRTWPVSGLFTRHQRILYELVLAVQKRLIEILGEHRPALDQLFDSMCRLLGTQLQQEGILPKNIDGHELISMAYSLCPHHVSHHLGLDVHDAPLVRRATPVLANMIVTVEPGIYIRTDDTRVPEEFRGLGIRIEDDVLITDGDPLVLTDSCAKEVQDIEAIVGKQAY
ncbi:xaa-Pro aminopeptidase 3 [Bombyx mori]|uniref:Aminopeptidase P N-terminal domain-containing protein n=1 Tax=Bombyx mori TaxID=7091 RepID=A0A8R1WLC8_BOMMO|nr:xaa-Pro aminopeptidase 3 [Bombyx mori]